MRKKSSTDDLWRNGLDSLSATSTRSDTWVEMTTMVRERISTIVIGKTKVNTDHVISVLTVLQQMAHMEALMEPVLMVPVLCISKEQQEHKVLEDVVMVDGEKVV